MHLRDDLTLLERRILSLLPLDGEKLGPHDLKKPVRAIVEDLSFEVTPDEVSGALRSMAIKGLCFMVGTASNKTGGWQATKLGQAIAREWPTMLVSHALVVANKEGDGLAAVHNAPDGPVVAYVLTPARYGRMADDPASGAAAVTPVPDGAFDGLKREAEGRVEESRDRLKLRPRERHVG